MSRAVFTLFGVPLLLVCSCGGGSNSSPLPLPPQNFTLQLSASSVWVIAGDQTSLNISVTPQNGFATGVNLSVSGLPSECRERSRRIHWRRVRLQA